MSTSRKRREVAGRIVQGCRLEVAIGSGGSGDVYRATQLCLDRPVAVKILVRCARTDSPEARRHAREIELHLALVHPNLVRVLDAGEECGQPVLVLEYIDGMSLRRKLHEERRLDEHAAVHVAAGIAAALEYLHAHGVVHRDIKPENILLSTDGAVKLCDLGLARSVEMTAITPRSAFVGTLGYVAPETLTEEFVGSPADVYALGLILFEMLSGAHPYPTDSIQELYRTLRPGGGRPAFGLPARVSDRLASLVIGMLSMDPGARPTAGEAARELAELALRSRPGAGGRGPLSSARSAASVSASDSGFPARRRVVVAALACLAGLILLAAGALTRSPAAAPIAPESQAERPSPTRSPRWRPARDFDDVLHTLLLEGTRRDARGRPADREGRDSSGVTRK